MAADRAYRLAMLALLAPVGLLAGHALTYAIAIPDADARALLLADSGHAWWALALPVVAILAAACAALTLVRHLSAPAGPTALGSRHCSWLAPRLGVLQLLLFAAVEVGERVVVGHSLHDLLHHRLIEHGVLAQVAVALLLTAVLWVLALGVERLCCRIASLWSPLGGQRSPRPGAPRRATRFRPVRPLGARAPPLPFVH